MSKVGILVGEQGDWKFFNEIFADLSLHYDTVTFVPRRFNTPMLHGRLNRWAFRRGVRDVMGASDVSVFEWASELLVEATHQPKRSKIVTRLHSYELFAWAPQVNWNHVDKIILVSQAMQRKFNELYPDHAHKTVVIYNAKPLDRFRPDPERVFGFDLGVLAAFFPRKRIYEVVLAHHQLIRQGYPARLHLAGGRVHGPDNDEYYVSIRHLVDRLALRDSVFFYDHVKNTSDWLRGIDIFISNSYWEGHQVALIEAMASGCYTLSHFWDGVAEVLPDDNIFVSEGELLQKIIAFSRLPDGEQAARRGEMRRLACEKYDQDDQLRQIREVIESVL